MESKSISKQFFFKIIYCFLKGTGEFINTHFYCRVCAMLNLPENSQRRREPEATGKWWKKDGKACK